MGKKSVEIREDNMGIVEIDKDIYKYIKHIIKKNRVKVKSDIKLSSDIELNITNGLYDISKYEQIYVSKRRGMYSLLDIKITEILESSPTPKKHLGDSKDLAKIVLREMCKRNDDKKMFSDRLYKIHLINNINVEISDIKSKILKMYNL